MFDKKLIISVVSAVLLYAILLKTTCNDKETTSYYDRNSMLYAMVVGVLVFLGMRSFQPPAPTNGSEGYKPVGENVMTTPFQ